LKLKTYSVFIYPVLKKYPDFKNIILLSAKSILQFFTAILVPKLNYLFSFIPEDVRMEPQIFGGMKDHAY